MRTYVLVAVWTCLAAPVAEVAAQSVLEQGRPATVLVGPFTSTRSVPGAPWEPAKDLAGGINVWISANGSALTPRAGSEPVAYDRDGFYRVPLAAEDIGEFGRLDVVVITGAGPPVRRSFVVMIGREWDRRFSAKVGAAEVTANVIEVNGNTFGGGTGAYLPVTVFKWASDSNTVTWDATSSRPKTDVDSLGGDTTSLSNLESLCSSSTITDAMEYFFNEATPATTMHDVNDVETVDGSAAAAEQLKTLSNDGVGTDGGIYISADVQDLSASFNVALSSNGLAGSAVDEIAADILLTPANKLGVDSAGRVEIADGVGVGQINTDGGSIVHVSFVGQVLGSVDSVADPVTIVDGSGVGEINTLNGQIVSTISTGGVTNAVNVDRINGTTLDADFDENINFFFGPPATTSQTVNDVGGSGPTAIEIRDAVVGEAADVWAAASRTLTGTVDANVIEVSDDSAAAGALELFIEALGSDDKVLVSTNAQDLSGTFSVALSDSGLSTLAAQEIRNAVTGGTYALDTDANGRMRIVDGTGAGEVDTASGHVRIVDGSGSGELNTLLGQVVHTITAGSVDSVVSANLTQIQGTGLSGAPTQLAGGFEYFFDVGTPSQTMNDVGASGPTAAAIADEVWDEPIAGHVGAGTFGSKNQIGVPSGTLGDYKATGFSTLTAAQVDAEVDEAIENYNLDHLLKVAVIGADVTNNSVIAKMVADDATADWDTFNNTTDSLEALREDLVDIDSAVGALNNFDPAADTVVTVATVTGNVGGNVVGSVGSVTAGVGVASIATNVITTASVAAGAFDSSVFGNNFIHAGAIAADAIGVGDIATGAVDADALAGSAANEIRNAVSGEDADVWGVASRTLSGTISDFDELDTALDTAHGAGDWITAIGFSTLTAAQVDAEVDEAIENYNLDHLLAAAVTGTDVVNNSVIAKLVADDATADWDTYNNTTDSLEAIRNYTGTSDFDESTDTVDVGEILGTAVTANLPGAINYFFDEASPTKTMEDVGVAGTPLSEAQVNAQVDLALSDINLDHLLKVAVANNADMTVEIIDGTVISNVLSSTSDTSTYVVSDDSLEGIADAVGGATNPNLLLSTTVSSVDSQTQFVLTAGSDVDNSYNSLIVVFYDATNSLYPSVRTATDYVGSTTTLVIDAAPDFTVAGSDTVKIFAAERFLDQAGALDTKTVRQVLRYLGAVIAGETSGAGSGTEVFKGVDGLTDRVQVTIDGNGDRTTVILDP